MVLYHQSAEAEAEIYNVTISSKGEMNWIETFWQDPKMSKYQNKAYPLLSFFL